MSIAVGAGKKNTRIPIRVVRPSTKKRKGFLSKLVEYLKLDSDFLYSVDAVRGEDCGAADLGSPVAGSSGQCCGEGERVADGRRHLRRVTRDNLSPEMTSLVKQSALQREHSTGENQGVKEYKNDAETLVPVWEYRLLVFLPGKGHSRLVKIVVVMPIALEASVFSINGCHRAVVGTPGLCQFVLVLVQCSLLSRGYVMGGMCAKRRVLVIQWVKLVNHDIDFERDNDDVEHEVVSAVSASYREIEIEREVQRLRETVRGLENDDDGYGSPSQPWEWEGLSVGKRRRWQRRQTKLLSNEDWNNFERQSRQNPWPQSRRSGGARDVGDMSVVFHGIPMRDLTS
ncbi:hypothetical protein AKJ16_DCAP00808 [Drosera capensis]